MTEPAVIVSSQEFSILLPQGSSHYSIACTDWALLRTNLESIKGDSKVFELVGAALIGVALTELVAILTQSFQLPAQQRQLDFAWVIFAAATLCGGLCFLFTFLMQRGKRTAAQYVIAQMELIEQRFVRQEQ